jgi:CelD/BcsL family acetyltransferase involved in cellulose biosynthesis
VDPRTDPRWAALAAGPGGGLFTSPPWIGAVCETYGFVPTGTVAGDGGGVPCAGLTWVDVDDLRGRRRLALPFCDRADPVVTDAAAWAAVSGDALTGDLPFTLRCLDGSPAADDRRLSRTGEAAWHRTPLAGSLEDLYARFRPQTRRNIATAERAGVQVRLSADMEAVHVYHDLHVSLRKHKYRLLAQPREFLEQIWKAFAPDDAIRTAIATVDGRPVAGAVYLVWQDTVYYKFGASEAATLPLRPNDAVHWALIRWAHARGLAHLDWGLSDLDQPGLVGYKRKWATEERRILTLNAGGAPLGRRADTERLLQTLTALFTDDSVPDAITARAGAALYGLFC